MTQLQIKKWNCIKQLLNYYSNYTCHICNVAHTTLRTQTHTHTHTHNHRIITNFLTSYIHLYPPPTHPHCTTDPKMHAHAKLVPDPVRRPQFHSPPAPVHPTSHTALGTYTLMHVDGQNVKLIVHLLWILLWDVIISLALLTDTHCSTINRALNVCLSIRKIHMYMCSPIGTFLWTVYICMYSTWIVVLNSDECHVGRANLNSPWFVSGGNHHTEVLC